MSEIVNTSVQPYMFEAESDTDRQTREVVITFSMQHGVFEWLVDKFM